MNAIKKYSPSDTEIKITAIDEWGNEATKLVKIKVKKEENIVKKLEPLNPLAIKSKTNDNKLALIIGIENYSNIVKASYADNDARYFKDYAKNTLGIKKVNEGTGNTFQVYVAASMADMNSDYAKVDSLFHHVLNVEFNW